MSILELLAVVSLVGLIGYWVGHHHGAISGAQAIADAKPWYTSKTLWFNFVVLALSGAEAQLGVMKDFMPGNWYAWVAFGLPIANAALRFISSNALTAGKAPQ